MNDKNIGYVYIFLAGVLWGSIGFFVTILNGMGVEPSAVAFIRISMGAMLLIPLMFFSGGTKLFRIDKKGLIICIALGALCQAMFNVSYTESINLVGVATGSVLLYTSPIFVSLMSKIVFKEKIGGRKLVALGINIIGCILTVTGGDFSSMQFSLFGVGAGVLAGFLYALMTIICTTTTGYNPLTITFYSFLSGTVLLAFITQPFGNLVQIAGLPLLLASIGYGLIPTVGSYFFYMKGLAMDLETSKVPVVASVETVVAALIGVIAFSEAMGIFKIIGICCVLLSIVIMNHRPYRSKSN